MLEPMGTSSYSEIKDSLRHLYLEDPRPWLVGFSGGKDSTMLASLNYPLCESYTSSSCFPLSTSDGGKGVVGSRFQDRRGGVVVEIDHHVVQSLRSKVQSLKSGRGVGRGRSPAGLLGTTDRSRKR